MSSNQWRKLRSGPGSWTSRQEPSGEDQQMKSSVTRGRCSCTSWRQPFRQVTFNINVNQLRISCGHISFCLIWCLFKCRLTEFHLLRLIFHLKVFTAVMPWPSSEVFANKQRRRRPRLMTLVWCLQIYLVRAGLSRAQQSVWRLYLSHSEVLRMHRAIIGANVPFWISVFQDCSVSCSQWMQHGFDILTGNKRWDQMNANNCEEDTQLTSCVTMRPELMWRCPCRSNHDDISQNKTQSRSFTK